MEIGPQVKEKGGKGGGEVKLNSKTDLRLCQKHHIFCD